MRDFRGVRLVRKNGVSIPCVKPRYQIDSTLTSPLYRNRGLPVPIQRIKTEYIGIYYRFGKNRMLPSGEPDRCYDICYPKANGQYTYEKVGWESEGYTVEDAIRIRGNRIKEIRHPELIVPAGTPPLTVEQAWRAYKKAWLPNLKRANEVVRTYERYLQNEFGHRPIVSITPQEIEQYKHRLLNKNSRFGTPLKPGSVKLILANLRRIISKALEWNMAPSVANPVSNFHSPKGSDRKREKYLTPEEAKYLLDELQYISCRLYEIVKIGLYTGLRLSEIISLKCEDIDISAYIIYIRDGKTGSRIAYIPEDLISLFQKRLQKARSEKTNNNQFLFSSITGKQLNPKHLSYEFSQTVTAIGMNDNVSDALHKITFHTLRHTFCSWLAMKGVPMPIIGELAGHKNIEITQRYTKLSSASKREALRSIGVTFQETLLNKEGALKE